MKNDITTNVQLENGSPAFAKPVLGDFVSFYKLQKEHIWEDALDKIIVEVFNPSLNYQYAYFTGYVLRVRHNWKYSKVAKRNRFEYEYLTIYRRQDGVIVTYHAYSGYCKYPYVDTLDNLA